MKFNIYSFFSGSGFLDLGFEHSGYEVVFVNEVNKNFLEAYSHARKKMKLPLPKHGYHNCDINTFLKGDSKRYFSEIVKEDKKSGIVGFIGGPPCPDFSVAGNNAGISGENGMLTVSYKRLILQEVPDFFLFENVKGLWSTQKHRKEYEKLKESLKRKGYFLTEKLVNSLEYGVPQERERIILFGIHRDVCLHNAAEMRRKFKTSFNWGNIDKFSISKVKEHNWPTTEVFIENSFRESPKNILNELSIEYWFEKNDVCNHPNSKDHFIPRKGKEKMETVEEGDVSRKSYKRPHRWRYSPTVAYGNNEVHLHPYKSRRLSVSEALALQSMPKNFEICSNLSLTEKFKTIGNGVPYLMGKGIAEQNKKFLKVILDFEKIKGR